MLYIENSMTICLPYLPDDHELILEGDIQRGDLIYCPNPNVIPEKEEFMPDHFHCLEDLPIDGTDLALDLVCHDLDPTEDFTPVARPMELHHV